MKKKLKNELARWLYVGLALVIAIFTSILSNVGFGILIYFVSLGFLGIEIKLDNINKNLQIANRLKYNEFQKRYKK
jgi:hypothetical protein